MAVPAPGRGGEPYTRAVITSRTTRGIAVAALAACLTAGCGAAARPGAAAWPSSHASASASASASTGAASAPAPTVAATPSAQMRAVLGAWMQSVANPDTDTITAATKSVVADIQRLDFADLSQHCTQLAQVVTASQRHRPAPDAAAEQHWSAALGDLQLAASTCMVAGARRDMAALQRTGKAMQAAEVEFDAFSARINQFG